MHLVTDTRKARVTRTGLLAPRSHAVGNVNLDSAPTDFLNFTAGYPTCLAIRGNKHAGTPSAFLRLPPETFNCSGRVLRFALQTNGDQRRKKRSIHRRSQHADEKTE
ncbi:hypothetical protein PUN28_006965 [Cardiocondyla obscurior]|uniref:Uncharacterized protein n=1 Tax=Cardiocondyla obscurior TaxID=286306 RepID=A0AAW2G0Y7_9HYME